MHIFKVVLKLLVALLLAWRVIGAVREIHGPKAFGVKVFTILKKATITVFFYEHHYLLQKNLNDELHYFAPKLENYDFRIISTTEELRKLQESGYIINAPFNLRVCYERFDHGQMAFCVFVNRDLAHMTFVFMNQNVIMGKVHPPMKFNPELEALLWGSVTAPKYREAGIYSFVCSQAFIYLNKIGKQRVLFAVSKDNEPVVRTQTVKFGATIYGEGRYLRLLGLYFWKEKRFEKDIQKSTEKRFRWYRHIRLFNSVIIMKLQSIMAISIGKLYAAGKSAFRISYLPLKITLNAVRQIRLGQWVITGQEHNTKVDLTLRFSGPELSKNYIRGLVFSAPCLETYLGKKWLWHISREDAKENVNCSLVITEIHKVLLGFFKLFNRKDYFCIPCLVEGELDIPADIDSLAKRSKSVRENIRKIKGNGLQFEITTDLRQYFNFYHNMYMPYAINRFGESALVYENYHVFSKTFKNSELILVKKGQEPIAGMLIRWKRNIPRWLVIGIKNGDSAYVKEGAISALYYYSIEHLRRQGYRKLNFGSSRAFLKDGVLKSKKEWGLTICRYDRIFLLMIPSLTKGVEGFLINNPFIVAKKSELNGAIFVDTPQPLSEAQIQELYLKWYLKGMNTLHLFHLMEHKIIKEDVL